MNKPTTALEVAKYIVHMCDEYGELITHLKLQKILYYAQADYLVKNKGVPLFDDPIEAWQYGPVVQSVYKTYKQFGRNPISILIESINLEEEQKRQIDKTLSYCLCASATELVNSIHSEDPWIDAYKSVRNGGSNVISTDSMYKFYSSLEKSREDLLAAIDNK